MKAGEEPRHGQPFTAREAALWGAAGLVVLCVYAGAGFSLLSERAAAPQGAAEPTAIMVDLAPAPPPAPREKAGMDRLDAEEVRAKPVPEPQKPVEEKSEDRPAPSQEPPPAPVPDKKSSSEKPDAVRRPTPEHLEQAMIPPIDAPEVPLPTPRPAPPPKPVKERPNDPPEKRPVHHDRPAPSKAAERAASPARQPPAPAAKAQSAGADAERMRNRWQARLLAHLERRKRYPASARARREEGTANVRFRIDASGTVLSVSLVRSSGFADLDAAVLAMIRRASPVPPPPPGVNRTIVVPIRFSLR